MKLDGIVEELSRPLVRERMGNLQEAVVITDSSGNIRYYNSQFESILGPHSGVENPLGANLFNGYPFEAGNQKQALLEEAIQIGENRFSSWAGYDKKNENERYFNIKISPFVDKSGAQIGLVDVTKEVQAATIDTLTGAYTQSYYLRELKEIVIAQAKKSRGEYLGVIGVDLKKLKFVNDKISHDEGNTLLKETARILRESVRGSDYVVRDGGDEFVILCPGAYQKGIDKIMKRIEEKILDYNGPVENSQLHIQLYKVGYAQQGDYDQLFSKVNKGINLQKRQS